LLTGYVAQAAGLEYAAIVAAAAAVGFSLAQRSLSTPARALRRRVARVDGAVVMEDGAVRRLDHGVLLQPLEHALRALSWSMVGLALALVGARFA
jgi:hypothetical protein